jgi:hypothetical protein
MRTLTLTLLNALLAARSVGGMGLKHAANGWVEERAPNVAYSERTIQQLVGLRLLEVSIQMEPVIDRRAFITGAGIAAVDDHISVEWRP